MKFNTWLPLLLVPLFAITASATDYTVTNVGLTFSPAAITVEVGDIVHFDIATIHNAVEVSEATWNADGTTPLTGGFSIPFGGGAHVFMAVGVHYYVCQAHASSGMKGMITVTPTTSATTPDAIHPGLELRGISPQPATDLVVIDLQTSRAAHLSVDIFDAAGRRTAAGIERALMPGAYSIPFSVEGLRSGVYFLRFLFGERILTVPLRVTR